MTTDPVQEKQRTRTFRSLYEVKNTYIPNKDLKFLEGQEDVSMDTFMKILSKVARPVPVETPQEEKTT